MTHPIDRRSPPPGSLRWTAAVCRADGRHSVQTPDGITLESGRSPATLEDRFASKEDNQTVY
jgi:hypothetical protein